eukprot:SAG25_NODE_3501_length_1060_cov_2.105099_2_plen_127_part_01
MAGGQLFMLAYSSITILNAVVKYLVLGKNQSTAQWGSLALVTVGLMVSGRAAQSLGNQVFLGVLCGCAACRRSHLCPWSPLPADYRLQVTGCADIFVHLRSLGGCAVEKQGQPDAATERGAVCVDWS